MARSELAEDHAHLLEAAVVGDVGQRPGLHRRERLRADEGDGRDGCGDRRPLDSHRLVGGRRGLDGYIELDRLGFAGVERGGVERGVLDRGRRFVDRGHRVLDRGHRVLGRHGEGPRDVRLDDRLR
jgi:hypothetical protein